MYCHCKAESGSRINPRPVTLHRTCLRSCQTCMLAASDGQREPTDHQRPRLHVTLVQSGRSSHRVPQKARTRKRHSRSRTRQQQLTLACRCEARRSKTQFPRVACCVQPCRNRAAYVIKEISKSRGGQMNRLGKCPVNGHGETTLATSSFSRSTIISCSVPMSR
jgi:hypothetical protein